MNEFRGCSRQVHLTGLVLWVLLVLMVGILPVSNFVGHSHWEYIKWIPTAEDLRSPKFITDTVLDTVGNIVLFFPLGFLLGVLLHDSGSSRSLIAAVVVAVMLSVGIELYQVYCHNRFPSIYDVITNVAGSVLGSRRARLGKILSPVPQQ